MNNNCTKCGNPLQPGTTICPICGTNNINANATPAAPAAQPVAPGPGPVPPVPPVGEPAPVAPVAEPAPVAPAPAPSPINPVPIAAPTEVPAAPAVKEKKPVNKKLFVIVGIIAAVIIIGAVVAMIVINNAGSVEEPAPINNNTQKKTAVSNKISLNGFEFTLPSGWIIDTTGGSTNIVNSNQSTIVQFLYDSGSVNDLNQDGMKSYLTNQGYDNVTSFEKTLNGKKTIVLTSTKPGTTYQYDFYYMESTNLIIGADVVYTDGEAKSQNTAVVDQIMSSLSYNQTGNMVSEIGMHSDSIGHYTGAVEASSVPTTNNNTPNENNTNPNESADANSQVDPNTQENQNENGGGRF